MPRTPIDYSKSVIYKIQHLEKDELVYVGSTTSFVKRKNTHKTHYNNGKVKSKVYAMIRENGGWDCFNMIIIKEYPCQTKTELLQEEDKVMRELKTSLNTIRSYLSPEDKIKKIKEYNEKNKEHQKEYREKNKEKIKEVRKEYTEKNKEKISNQQKIYQKEYRKKNKEEILKKDKERYEKNKEVRKKKAREAYQKKKINAIDLKK